MTGVWLEGWEAVRSWFLEVTRFALGLTAEAHQRAGSQESSHTRSGFLAAARFLFSLSDLGKVLGGSNLKDKPKLGVRCAMFAVPGRHPRLLASSLPTLWVLEVKVTCLSWLSCVLHLIWEVLTHRTPDTCVWVNGMCIRGSFGKWPVGSLAFSSPFSSSSVKAEKRQLEKNAVWNLLEMGRTWNDADKRFRNTK